MTETIAFGFLSAVAFFILLAKVNLTFFARYHWQTDILFTALMSWLFFGTFSGMITAAVAGIFFSAFLFIARYVLRFSMPVW